MVGIWWDVGLVPDRGKHGVKEQGQVILENMWCLLESFLNPNWSGIIPTNSWPLPSLGWWCVWLQNLWLKSGSQGFCELLSRCPPVLPCTGPSVSWSESCSAQLGAGQGCRVPSQHPLPALCASIQQHHSLLCRADVRAFLPCIAFVCLLKRNQQICWVPG